MAQPVHFKAVVDRVEQHDADVASFRLISEKRLPRFTPGQFIHLTLDEYDPSGFWPESRVFSVANAVADRRTLELTISRQGRYTRRILDEVHAGGTVWGKGPYGEFSIDGRNGSERAVLIAGGTGITPFCAFMDDALHERVLPLKEVTLYYGARTPELLIYQALARRCAAELPGFRMELMAERGGGGDVRTGRLNVEQIVRETGGAQGMLYFLSGPMAMIKSFQRTLIEEFRAEPSQVVIDAWE
ncbi:ferredoxin--NADP reductase [Paludibaculum fermentans]|uniref:FAD-dependent oxidoreductase n=1 Tax=Paludibaculum fermentans TaxID=1473598 RepID=A0A7S7SGR3_PALFE|nr:FAD-dependent oxidoreductase [Paludibaculum fermentans]QOY85102.1 FAD-dependent oxidoreductase [Paludibaculum fermentans]